jgi:hypothetical protein
MKVRGLDFVSLITESHGVSCFFLRGRLGPFVLGSVIYKPCFETKEQSEVVIKLGIMSLLACTSFMLGHRSLMVSYQRLALLWLAVMLLAVLRLFVVSGPVVSVPVVSN